MNSTTRVPRAFRFSGLIAVALAAAAASAGARPIVVSTTIQAAVNASRSGDTVKVPAGTYRENVLVTKNNITIEGSPGAVLDGAGLSGDTGIHAAPLSPAATIKEFRLRGLTIQNYSGNGVLIENGRDFEVTGGTYSGNGEYGIFALHSEDGRIVGNSVSGSNDTAIYVGQSRGIMVGDNVVDDSTVGIEVENSLHVTVSANRCVGNSAGILVDVLPGLDETVTNDITVRNNLLLDNNRANPVTDPNDILSLLPSGVGLLNVGGDGLTVTGNIVTGNVTAGILIAQLPPDAAALDPRINPFPDHNEIRKNVSLENGGSPDPKIAPLPGADLVWDTSGSDNCWAGNTFETSFPDPLPRCGGKS
jgi:parallel beta-helix repeat protein